MRKVGNNFTNFDWLLCALTARSCPGSRLPQRRAMLLQEIPKFAIC